MDQAPVEPQLDEMLEDPIVQAVMARDGLDRHAVLKMIDAARARLQRNAEQVG